MATIQAIWFLAPVKDVEGKIHLYNDADTALPFCGQEPSQPQTDLYLNNPGTYFSWEEESVCVACRRSAAYHECRRTLNRSTKTVGIIDPSLDVFEQIARLETDIATVESAQQSKRSKLYLRWLRWRTFANVLGDKLVADLYIVDNLVDSRVIVNSTVYGKAAAVSTTLRLFNDGHILTDEKEWSQPQLYAYFKTDEFPQALLTTPD